MGVNVRSFVVYGGRSQFEKGAYNTVVNKAGDGVR